MHPHSRPYPGPSQARAGDSPSKSECEEYNGSTWTEGDDLNTGRARSGGGMGIQTAAVMVGGRNPGNVANVEEYNGTSWSEVNDIPAATQRNTNLGT